MDDSLIYAELEKRVTKCEGNISILFSQSNALAISQVRTEESLKYLCKMVEDLTKNVESLMKQPAKRLDFLTTAIIAAVINFISMGGFYIIFHK
jgi:hypothetical protein